MPRCLGCSVMIRCGRGPGPGAGGTSRPRGQPQGGGVAGGGGAAAPRVTVLREAAPRDTRRGSPSPGPGCAPSRPKPFSLMYSSMISAGEAKPRDDADCQRKGFFYPQTCAALAFSRPFISSRHISCGPRAGASAPNTEKPLPSFLETDA